jgi:protoporphyrinogen oxidase
MERSGVADVIIVGGGLTGMSAAWELERLRIPYRLIEVKKRLGGSIVTRRERGFVLDGNAFALEQYGEWAFLAELGLENALVPIGKYRDGQLVVFRDGTQTLIDAIEQRLTAPIMTRMAVSSIGQIEAEHAWRFGVCLENGLMLDARAVIVTAPARYAEHMLRARAPDAALLLMDYRYDPVVRVSLGVRAEDAPALRAATLPENSPFKFLQHYDMPERVPAGHVLIRAGVRLNEAIQTPDDALRRVKDAIGVREPVVEWAYYWAEADSLSRYLPEHDEAMDAIDRTLPPGVVIAGSDYRAKRLDQQVEQGRAAARKIAEWLR